MAASDALDPNHLFEHVQDADYFEVPRTPLTKDGHISLPQPWARVKLGEDGKPLTDAHGRPVYEPVWTPNTGVELLDQIVQPVYLKLTKFMVLEVVVAVILCAIFMRLASKMRGGAHVKGRVWNMLEALLVYLRDYVARPAIGSHDADRFVPLVWTVFFFVLGCNLMGMVPWLGSPTGALGTTAALALVTFFVVIGSGMAKLGV